MKKIANTAVVVLAASLTATTSFAGGMFVSDIGSQAMSRGGAFVAKADDPTALWHNPAGLMKSKKRFEVYVGSNFLDYAVSFDRAGVYPDYPLLIPDPDYAGDEFPEVSHSGSARALPFIGATQRFGRFALGEAIFGPSGYPDRQFPETVATRGSGDVPAPQRYDMIEQEATVALPSLGAAYSITDKLDVGARVSWGFAHINIHNVAWGVPELDLFGLSIELDDEMKELDADFKAKVSDNFIPNFGFGVLFRPHPNVELGAAYQSAIKIRAKGTSDPVLIPATILGNQLQVEFTPLDATAARCATGGAVGALKTCLDMNMPQVVTMGGRYVFRDGAGNERADVELDVRWENWSAASDIVVTVDGEFDVLGIMTGVLQPNIIRHGFRDVLSVRLGGSFRQPIGDQLLEVRAGLAHDGAAAPDSWTRLDIDGKSRTTLSAGLAYELSLVRFSVGVSAISEPDVTVERVAITDPAVVDSRQQPDPAQPSQTADATLYHPINDGTYRSSYFVLSAGATVRW